MISSLELARICGVSQGTVDRALHDRPGISPNTKARVLAAAEKYGYQPNPAARELLTGDRRVIGAIVPSVNSVFFMDLMSGIREQLAGDNFKFFLTPVNNKEDFFEVLEDFSARRARAIIAVPPEDGLKLPKRITHNTTIITLIGPCKGDSHFIAPDEIKAGRDAVDYLYSKGHRRIVHLTYVRKQLAIDERAQGYSDRMKELGLEPVVMTDIDNGKLGAEIKQNGWTAAFCHNDWMVLRASRILESVGMSVPDDFSMIGVDNSPTFIELCPGITTMYHPVASIGRAIRGILVDGDYNYTIENYGIVERESVREIYPS